MVALTDIRYHYERSQKSNCYVHVGLYEQNSYNVTPCMDHKETSQIISTWLPEKIGGMSGKSVIFAETQVKFTKVYHELPILQSLCLLISIKGTYIVV